MSRNTSRIGLSTTYWAFVIYLFIPILVMVAVSFKDSRFVGFPIDNWTLRWYLEVIQDTDMMAAFGYSVFIALASTAFALLIGLPVGLLLGADRFWGKTMVFGLMILPALIPARGAPESRSPPPAPERSAPHRGLAPRAHPRTQPAR